MTAPFWAYALPAVWALLLALGARVRGAYPDLGEIIEADPKPGL